MVSEITIEIRMAIDSVTANSWNSSPGHAHRDDRESDLGAAAQGRFPWTEAEVEMADDVLEHHYCIIDNEARADGECHQRKIVDAVAQEVHRPERTDDRQGQRHRGNPDRARRLQKDEDHRDHKHHGHHQGALGIVDRGVD